MLPRILTGITTTGIPHLGNYVGAIRPAIQASAENDNAFFFLADYHALLNAIRQKRFITRRCVLRQLGWRVGWIMSG
nr:hypothetical protein [Rappaport israeli]